MSKGGSPSSRRNKRYYLIRRARRKAAIRLQDMLPATARPRRGYEEDR
jgi:hypothetical protein